MNIIQNSLAVSSLLISSLAASAAELPLPLDGNGRWQSGVVYRADRRVYEISPSDREPVDCPSSHVRGHNIPRRTAFHLKGLRDITLDFNGSMVLLHGKMQPFLLEHCTNVTVANVSVKYVRSPYTEGRVVAREGQTLRVKFGHDFPVSVENGELYFIGEGWKDGPIRRGPCFMQFFDPKTRAGKAIFTAFFAGTIPASTMPKDVPWAKHSPQFTPRVEGDTIVLASDRPLPAAISAGDFFVIGHAARNHSNIEMAECENVTIRNYRILNGLGMGVFPFHCHNVTLDGVKMFYDEKSPSIIANSADGIHAFACSGDFIVRNSIVESTIDDALNVHANFYVVEKAAGNEIVAFTGLEPEGPTAIFRPGDRIAVCKGHTLDKRGEWIINAQRVIDNKHVAFTLDRPITGAAAKDVIENLSAQCRLLISNSRFGKANSHLRLQTRGGIVIENCESELPFILTGDMNYWYESSPCEKLIVRNTRFHGGRAAVRSCPEWTPTKENPHYHGDIVVENCTFDTPDALFARGARSLTARGCRTADGSPVKIAAEGCPRTQVIRK